MIPLNKQKNITCEHIYTSTNNCLKITLLNRGDIVRIPILILGAVNNFNDSGIVNSTLLVARDENTVPKLDCGRKTVVERNGSEIYLTDGVTNAFVYSDFIVITQPNIKIKVEAVTR